MMLPATCACHMKHAKKSVQALTCGKQLHKSTPYCQHSQTRNTKGGGGGGYQNYFPQQFSQHPWPHKSHVCQYDSIFNTMCWASKTLHKLFLPT